MSNEFKLRFNEMRESDPTRKQSDGSTETSAEQGPHEYYETVGHARSLILAWPDDKRVFLNYSYLIGGEFKPGGEKNEITLDFGHCTVTLKGFGLEPLFEKLLDHLVRAIHQSEIRYLNTEQQQKDNCIVEITVIRK